MSWIAVGSSTKGRISCDAAGNRTAILVHPLLIITVPTELLRLVPVHKVFTGFERETSSTSITTFPFRWPLTIYRRNLMNFI